MSEKHWPIVTVICPTTRDRKVFNDRIFDNFLKQDYPSKIFLYDFDEGTIGEKRNRLCEKAVGDIIVHMDSDDMYASNWITQSVVELMKNEADIVGLASMYFYKPDDKSVWLYTYGNATRPWIAGATMCYWRNLWKNNPFQPLDKNEDGMFLLTAPATKILAHGYIDGFVATVHEGNTCKKTLENIRYRRLSEEEEEEFFKRVTGNFTKKI